MARYDILYRLGGAYADADVELTCGNPFRCKNSIYTEFPGRWAGLNAHYAQSAFSASKHAPWLRFVIESVAEAVKTRKRCTWRDVLWRTGPKVFSAAVLRYVSRHCNQLTRGELECEGTRLCIHNHSESDRCFKNHRGTHQSTWTKTFQPDKNC